MKNRSRYSPFNVRKSVTFFAFRTFSAIVIILPTRRRTSRAKIEQTKFIRRDHMLRGGGGGGSGEPGDVGGWGRRLLKSRPKFKKTAPRKTENAR